MASLRSLSTFAVLCGALAFALPAEARGFGKSGGSSGGSGGGGTHSASPSGGSGGGGYHSASPGAHVAPNSGYRGGYRGGYSGGGYGYLRGGGYVGRPRYDGWGYSRPCWNSAWGCGGYGWGYGYQPLFYSAPVMAPTVVGQPPPQEGPQPEGPVFTLGVQGHMFTGTGGGSLGVNAAFEQNRIGVATEFNALMRPADDGSGGKDQLKLWNAHLTYAVLSGERGRLRLGAGVDTAFAQDATFVGPGFLVQGALGLFGPVGLEGTVNVTPYPFTQVDWSAGATLALGPVGLRAGWRRIYLNDQGRVDGVAHDDLFQGPYAGISLAL